MAAGGVADDPRLLMYSESRFMRSAALSLTLCVLLTLAGGSARAQTRDTGQSQAEHDSTLGMPAVIPPASMPAAPAPANDPCRHLSPSERAQFPALCQPPESGPGHASRVGGFGRQDK